MGYCFWAGCLGFPLAGRFVQGYSTFYGVHVEAKSVPDLFSKRLTIIGATFLFQAVLGTIVGFFGGALYRFVQLWRVVV